MRLFVAWAACAALLALCDVTPASAVTTNGVALSTYVSGMPAFGTFPNRGGPFGIAMDSQSRLYVADAADHSLYRFDGPTSTPSDGLLATDLGDRLFGLAFDGAGHLFLARGGEKDVVELDPDTGEILRTVAKVPCALGLADDPISGDLFVTEGSCGHDLVRIVDPMSSDPQVVTYASGLDDGDGITIGPKGRIYVVDNDKIIRFSETSSPNPGKRTLLALVPNADGVALGGGTPDNPSFLLVNRTDGAITRVDLALGGSTNVVSGGTRGDFVAVGPDGCLYATQSEGIVKVTNPDGTCRVPAGGSSGSQGALGSGGLYPTTPPARVDPLPVARGCIDTRKWTFHLHHARRTHVVAVDLFVNGRRRLHLHGKRITRVTLGHLPQQSFKVRIVATQSNGSRLISSRTYHGCTKSRPHTQGIHAHRTPAAAHR